MKSNKKISKSQFKNIMNNIIMLNYKDIQFFSLSLEPDKDTEIILTFKNFKMSTRFFKILQQGK
jgi:predicted nucleic acid-binding protein